MTADIIDGRVQAKRLVAGLRQEVARLDEDGVEVGLATIRVGADFGSVAYERRLGRLADQLAIPHQRHLLDERCDQAELETLVCRLNADPKMSGVLILRPLPPQMDEAGAFQVLDPSKDIEAVHPENAGLLALGVPRFLPPTAASVFHLCDTWLDSVGEDRDAFYRCARIVVVGRSNNVGKPCVSLGYARQAAVESVDEWASRSGRLGLHTRGADVLVVAAGAPGLIRAEHVSEHAVVIDVGINPAVDPDGRVHMVGDVDFASTSPRVRALTPVPGGVGPVTDVWLLHNAVLAARLQAGLDVVAGALLVPATHQEVP